MHLKTTLKIQNTKRPIKYNPKLSREILIETITNIKISKTNTN